MKSERQFLGHFAVDSGQAIVGDPGTMDFWIKTSVFDPEDNGELSYNGASGATLARMGGELEFPTGAPSAAVAFRTGLGDGVYPVFATIVDVPGWGKRVGKIEILMLDDEALED